MLLDDISPWSLAIPARYLPKTSKFFFILDYGFINLLQIMKIVEEKDRLGHDKN